MAKSPLSTSAVKGGRPAGLFTWITIGVVLLVVAVLVIVKVTNNGGANGSSVFQPTSASLASEVTGVPTSVFNSIGVTSSATPASMPQAISGQPTFTATVNGKKLPEILYVGAEYCPYCAAERWANIVALSRFGTFSGLGNMESSTHTGEVYPGTPTFTFLKAKYTSPYVAFSSVEEFTNVWSNSIGYYTSLQKPSKAESANFGKYDTSAYIKGITSQQNGSIPFINFANKFLVAGASFSPAILAGLTRDQIAAGLSDPTSPITQAIIAVANYQTAAICSITNNQPSTVCASPGVALAKKAMKLK